MLLIRKRAEHRVLDCLNPINQEKRRNLNIIRIYNKLIARFPDEKEKFDKMINFENLGEFMEKKDEEVYKNFYKICDHNVELYEEINKIGTYKCQLCMREIGETFTITLNHLEDYHNLIFDKKSLLEDIMKKKSIFRFIEQYGEIQYIYN